MRFIQLLEAKKCVIKNPDKVTFVGISTEKEQCELCGKEGLRKTIGLRLTSGDVVYYGSECASNTLMWSNKYRGLTKKGAWDKALDAQKQNINIVNGEVAMSKMKNLYNPIQNVIEYGLLKDNKHAMKANLDQIKILVRIVKKEIDVIMKKYPTVSLDYIHVNPFTNSKDEIDFRKINKNIIPKEWGFKRNVKSIYR
jgi:hypothetical protein